MWAGLSDWLPKNRVWKGGNDDFTIRETWIKNTSGPLNGFMTLDELFNIFSFNILCLSGVEISRVSFRTNCNNISENPLKNRVALNML